ncbi:hypothetical protein [Caballeronia sp. LZ035]|uniref:hypothetical protein n=1 Tax=Caballeronia sp. LZ035 TaxID=3038568 RepID=UPI00285BFBF1|nr:hypothetical protein [Caballeronia sp. LZ035]MDR5760158.1 hypothetical protein [Caballeronia sp. LZ035]
MSSPIVDLTLYQPDATVLPPPPTHEPGPVGLANHELTHIAEHVQNLVHRPSAAIAGMLDPARRQGPTTGEMLMLQAAVSDYSITLQTVSHLAQATGSAIQSLTQRT